MQSESGFFRYEWSVRPGHLVILCALALLSLGVVMAPSAGLSLNHGQAVTPEAIAMSRPAMYMALALVAMALGSVAPVRRALEARSVWRGPVWLLLLALGACLLVYLPSLQREVNGAKRWISLDLPGVGPLSVQPSELAKWASVAFVAWFGAWRGAEIRRFVGGLGIGLAPVALLAGLILVEDLGTAALIVAVAGLALVAAGVRWWHVVALVPAGVGAIALGILAEPYRMARLAAFLHPYADPSGTGYQAIQSMAAVAGGGGFGRGLGFGIQKFGYLPDDQTDFIFAIVCEELGIAGAAVVISLLLALLWSGWTIARNEQSRAMRLFALGALATVGAQAIINLAAVTGLGPTKGIALPLVSSGGTGWVLTAAALGVLVGMDRRQAKRETASASEPTPRHAPGAHAAL